MAVTGNLARKQQWSCRILENHVEQTIDDFEDGAREPMPRPSVVVMSNDWFARRDVDRCCNAGVQRRREDARCPVVRK